MIKVEKSSGCFQCAAKCMTLSPGSSGCTPGFCGCPQGMTKWTGQTASGGSCHKCIDPNVPGPPCAKIPSYGSDSTCSCKAPAERKTLEQGGQVFYGCSSEGGGGNSSGGGGGNAGGASSKGGGGACPIAPGGTSRASCTCEAPAERQTTEEEGQVWYACNSACPTVPSYGGEESCFCNAPAEKKTLEQGGQVYYGCSSDGGGGNSGGLGGDDGGDSSSNGGGGKGGGGAAPGPAPAPQQCHSTGNACTLSKSCICPRDTGLRKKETKMHGDGGVCYVCRMPPPPPLCTSEPGFCTGNELCECKAGSGLTKRKHSAGNGAHCYSCG